MFSAFIKEVDGKTNTDTIWGKKSSFGSCLSEFSNGRGMLLWVTVFARLWPIAKQSWLHGCYRSGNGQGKDSEFYFESGKIKILKKSQGKLLLHTD